MHRTIQLQLLTSSHKWQFLNSRYTKQRTTYTRCYTMSNYNPLVTCQHLSCCRCMSVRDGRYLVSYKQQVW